MELRGASVREILDAIVAVHPEYSWQISRGVLNLIPRAALENRKKYASPLDRMIGSLDIVKEPLPQAVRMIGAKVDIQEPTSFVLFGGDSTPVEYRQMSLRLHNISARDALNELVRADGRSMWVFERGSPSGWLYIHQWDMPSSPVSSKKKAIRHPPPSK
ncbi:MAG: hypothetical protein HY927_02120 [Elusimicrobia bacterium]|nr:hypothetical protein [Elusimicrobiota bacterium]